MAPGARRDHMYGHLAGREGDVRAWRFDALADLGREWSGSAERASTRPLAQTAGCRRKRRTTRADAEPRVAWGCRRTRARRQCLPSDTKPIAPRLGCPDIAVAANHATPPPIDTATPPSQRPLSPVPDTVVCVMICAPAGVRRPPITAVSTCVAEEPREAVVASTARPTLSRP